MSAGLRIFKLATCFIFVTASFFCRSEEVARKKYEMSQAEAKQLLKKNGFYKNNYWHVRGEKLVSSHGVLGWTIDIVETPDLKDGSYCWARMTRVLDDSELCRIDDCSGRPKRIRQINMNLVSGRHQATTCRALDYPDDFVVISGSINSSDLDEIYSFFSGTENTFGCKKINEISRSVEQNVNYNVIANCGKANTSTMSINLGHKDNKIIVIDYKDIRDN